MLVLHTHIYEYGHEIIDIESIISANHNISVEEIKQNTDIVF
ncbi:hypothetical protein [Fusobacterium sp. PH5-44]